MKKKKDKGSKINQINRNNEKKIETKETTFHQ